MSGRACAKFHYTDTDRIGPNRTRPHEVRGLVGDPGSELVILQTSVMEVAVQRCDSPAWRNVVNGTQSLSLVLGLR